MTDQERLIDVLECYGQLQAPTLAHKLGIRETHATCPTVRALIRQAIEDGHPIASNHGGYWLANESEALTVVASLMKRAAGIIERAEALSRAAARGTVEEK